MRNLSLLLGFWSLGAIAAAGQEWPSYGGDPGGMKYSELRQIDRSNVSPPTGLGVSHWRRER